MRKVITIVLLIFTVFIAKAYYDTNSLEIKHHTIQNIRLEEVLRGLKIAHISDLHIKRIGPREKKIINILNEEKPDLIFFTGDFIGFKCSFNPVISFFRELRAGTGIYGVLGNIDYSNENGSCMLCHKEGSKELIGEHINKVNILRNSAIELNINGKPINIIGLDDPVERKDDLRIALSKVNPIAPSILMAHSPRVFKKASNLGIDLLLCGHNHGGQIFFLKYFRSLLKDGASLKYLEGFYQQEKTLMHVSRGAGTSFLPFRLGVKPEITFIQFANFQDSSDTNIHLIDSPSVPHFAGLSLSSIIDLFDYYPISGAILYLKALVGVGNVSGSMPSAAGRPVGHQFGKAPALYSTVLYDFETEAELQSLNWECHKWFERSTRHYTSGEFSLRVVLPPGKYPGVAFKNLKGDWTNYDYFKLDVFNPADNIITLHVRIDDHKSGLEYANRFDQNYFLEPGKSTVSILLKKMRTNFSKRGLDLNKIKKLIIFIPQNGQKRELFLDNIRLES